MHPYFRIALLAGLLFGQIVVSSAQTTSAGDLIAEIITPEPANGLFGKAIGYDGQYLYYTEWAGSILHRIDVPPPGLSSATGHTDIPIQGAPTGIMTISYDAGRDAFWAVGGDGLTIYLLTNAGEANLRFIIDPLMDRPGNCKPRGALSLDGCLTEAKINYDATDDTIWYAPDTSKRIYHYTTVPDDLGTAQLVAGTPWIDVDVPPNDMNQECGYSQVSGVAVGGDYLLVNVSGCPLYFKYSKDGTKVGSYPINPIPSGDLECDNRSYAVSVIWSRDGWSNGNIYAHQQPFNDACQYGGGRRLP